MTETQKSAAAAGIAVLMALVIMLVPTSREFTTEVFVGTWNGLVMFMNAIVAFWAGVGSWLVSWL